MDGCSTTESGLQTCYGKTPPRRGLSMAGGSARSVDAVRQISLRFGWAPILGRPGPVVTGHRALVSHLEPVGDRAQAGSPATRRADRVTHPLPALAVALQVTVLELDAGAIRSLRQEAHFDLARLLEVGLELPMRADVPADHEPVRRLVGEYARPPALAAVHAAVVDVAAHPRFEHHRG